MSRNKWKSGVDDYIGPEPILSPEKKAIILSRIRQKEKMSVRKPIALYGIGLTAALIAMIFLAFQLQTNDGDLLSAPEDVNGALQEELDALNEENQALRENLERMSLDLQTFEHTARGIISLLGSEDFDELKERYNVEYNVKDDRIEFEGYEGFEINNPTNIINYPMRFIYIDYSGDEIKVNYYFYNRTPGEEGKFSIIFGFNNDRTIKYMVSGD
ncbi:hypothetical protein [Sutcliffiella rhizosphaerae]|uniref:Uncharacterized protein n=1 Tax=Sutcliffiella rhizosphaerae TaxID=2880967 RepID=A0ABM8YKC0_9BACI|nr:hypothetical protein [Sutcliffiella rhizosphaerae]CAG9620359.1 hypothetical protein BACCIP111883_01127 [Sutcliffiella rhizosphaerae]